MGSAADTALLNYQWPAIEGQKNENLIHEKRL
jgi:hypothetical protein